MQRSQLVAGLMLAGAFLGGGAVGYAADHLAAVEHDSCRALDSRAYWDRIGREWALTPAQRRVIDSLMDAQRVQIAALYRPLRPRIDSVTVLARLVSDTTQAHLRLVLTPDQQAKLDQMRAEVRRREEERRARRDEDLAKIR